MSSPAVPFTPASAEEYNLLRAEINAVAIRGWRRRTTSSTATTATTQAGAQKVLEATAPIVSGHIYRVALDASVSSSAAGGVQVQLTYTTNGTTPTVSGTRLRWQAKPTVGSNTAEQFNMAANFVAVSAGTLRVLAAFHGYLAGTYTMVAVSDAPTDLTIFDMGVSPAQTGADF